MRKAKLVSFLVLSLLLSVALPVLTLGQTAAGGKGGGTGSGGQATPVPATTPVPGTTPTPVVGDDDGDDDMDGCFGVMCLLYDLGERHHHHHHHFGFGNRERCDRD